MSFQNCYLLTFVPILSIYIIMSPGLMNMRFCIEYLIEAGGTKIEGRIRK